MEATMAPTAMKALGRLCGRHEARRQRTPEGMEAAMGPTAMKALGWLCGMHEGHMANIVVCGELSERVY